MFLNFFYNSRAEVYKEAGWVVELLINKFGAQKIVDLVKSLKNVRSPEDFSKLFKDIYGFELSYEKINELYCLEKTK